MKTICSERRGQCVSSRSMVLIIVWDALMYLHPNLIRYFVTTDYYHNHIKGYNVVDLAICLLYLCFPLFGLLADVKTGRYNTIITGVYLSFLSWIFYGLSFICKLYRNVDVPYWMFLILGYILQVIGYCSFRSNIIQFNIDQLVGASANKLSAVIYWHSVSIPIVIAFTEIGKCLIRQFVIVSYVVSGLAVTTVIVSNYLFKHWLDTIPHIINPVKLIAKVLNYARKNKYPRNRSALTYWEEDYPSRLDLGKQKYGGPFSEEHVEDVKTVLRLIPLFVSIIGFSCAQGIRLNNYHAMENNSQFLSCYVLYGGLYFFVVLCLILLHQLVLYPYMYKWIPSILQRVGLGLVFALLVQLYYVIMFACKDYFQLDTTSYKAIILPESLLGVSYALILPTSLEFTIAQSPHEMRGFMVGMWYAVSAIGYAFNINGKYPFKCEGDIICPSLYYNVFKSVIVLTILIVFAVLAKQYKLRVRENEVNIHWITEEHYERYMEQEVEYRREMGLSY